MVAANFCRHDNQGLSLLKNWFDYLLCERLHSYGCLILCDGCDHYLDWMTLIRLLIVFISGIVWVVILVSRHASTFLTPTLREHSTDARFTDSGRGEKVFLPLFLND